MEQGNATSGFLCPYCEQDQKAYIIGGNIVRILELECAKCHWQWIVEN